MLFKNKKRPIIIEFFGVPGVGKTTISKELIEYLGNNGYKVSDFSVYRKSKNIYPLRRRLKWFFLLLSNLKLVVWLLSFNPLNLRYRLGHLLDALWIEKELKKNYFKKFDYVIVDQGASQAISAVLDMNEYSDSQAIDQFLNKSYNRTGILLVSCFVEHKIALQRLRTRSKANNHGKMDYLGDIEEIKLLYEAISKNVGKIAYRIKSYQCNVLELDTMIDTLSNVKKICNQVLRKRNESYEH